MASTPNSSRAGGDEQLPEWGNSPAKQPTPKTAEPRKRRRWPRIVGALAVMFLVALGAAILFAPAIASAMAPGMIESAAKEEIKGSVKVKGLSLGWSGPMKIGPVELYDDKGALVGEVAATLSPGLWTIVSERWWSRKELDVGQIDVAGKLDVVKDADTTNLQRAIEPTRPSKPSKPSSGGMPFDSIKANLKLTGLDVTFTDKTAAAGTPMASGVGVSKFGGDVKVDYNAKNGAAVAKADLEGGLRGAGSGSDKITITADINLKQNAQKQLENIDGKIDVLGAPLDLIDGLAGFGGELAKSIGARGDVRVQVNGNLDKAVATLNAIAEGASADLAFEYSGGVLKTSKPGVVKLRSTDFIGGMPSLKTRMAELAKNVRLDAGPSVELTIASLALPLPKSAIGLEPAAAGQPTSPAEIDLRTGAVDLVVAIGAQRGQINTGGLGAGANAANPAPAQFKPFAVDPIVLKVNAPTLAGVKRITAATKATVEGKPAGQLDINLAATGLLDINGRFNATALQKIEGEATLLGVTTALLQPIVDAAGVPLDLAQDVGPSLDLVVKPTATAVAGAEVPATDVNIAITSANIRSNGDIRYDNNKISTLANSFSVDIASAGPLVARFMSTPGEPAGSATVSGKLPVSLKVSDLLVDLAKTDPSNIRATAEVRVSDGSVALNLAAPAEGQPAPAPVAPIALQNATVTAVLVPGSPAAANIDASLSHENNPFTVRGNFTAPGLATPKPANAPAAGPIDSLIAMKIGGRLDVQDVPKSLAKLVPAADAALNPTGADGTAEIKRLISGLIGPKLNLAFTTEAGEGVQRAKIDLSGAGLTATTTAAVTPADVSISVFSAQTRLTPQNAAPVLAAFTPKHAAEQGQPVPAVTPMALGAPVTLMVAAEPVRVPFKAGTTSPDLGAVKEIAAKITTDKPLYISNIPSGTGKSEAAGLGNLMLVARVPGAYLADNANAPAAIAAKVTADVLRPAGGGGSWTNTANAEICAKADLEASIPKDSANGETAFAAKLIDVNAVALSPLTGDPLLLPGTLGDRVQITASGKLSGSEANQRITFQADIEAPRLKGASIHGGMQNDIARVDAAKLTWTPSLAWFNSTVFKSADGTPTDQLAQETTFTLDVKSLTASMPKSDDKGVAIQGPMKPGVFNADISLTSPGATIKRPDGKTVQAQDIRVALLGGRKPGSVSLDATIAKVVGEGAAGDKPSVLKASIDNLADARGILTTDKAIINATGDLDTFPTPLIDTVAGMNGKIVDLLGSTLNLQLSVQNLSKTTDGGVLQATAGSPRASAEVKGVIRNQTFVQDGKFELDVYELIRYEMAKKLPGGMPLVGFIEKKKGVDQPGKIKAEGLRVPIDNDMRKLNGVITVDPGTASFEFNDAFSKILKQLSQKDRGQVGRRLDPFVVNIKDGVARYDKFRLQFGEFSLETTGAADLVQKRIDVVTYIPAGAVTEEVLGLFRGTLGKNAKGFTADTKFPFTTKGPLDNPKTEPDFALFLKENAGKLIEDVGKGALEDLLKRLKKD